MNKLVVFGTLGLLVLDAICIIIATSIDYWVYSDHPSLVIYSGLWETCQDDKVASLTTCHKIEGDTDINAVRSMVLVALFVVIVTIVCLVLTLCVHDEKCLQSVTVGLLGAAGLFLMIGFADYHRKIFVKLNDASNDAFSLHAGFAFCVIAWLLTWIGAGTTAVMAFVIGDTE